MRSPAKSFAFQGGQLSQIAALSLSLFAALIVPVCYGAHRISGGPTLAVLIIAILTLVFGKSLGYVLRIPQVVGFQNAAEIVLGFSALSLVHLFATVLFNFGAGSAFVCDLFVVAAAVLAVSKGHRGKSLSTASADLGATWRSTLIDCSVIVLLGLLTTLWTREALGSVAEAKQTGIFRVWNDFLLQAAEIQYQINYPYFNGESPYLSGLPQAFYHRASYSLAALFAWVSETPPLEAATYFWLPAGLVMMGLGAYSLGSVLGGRLVGILTVLALFLLPDASMYGLKNGYFAFYWLITVAPGAGYAMALSFLALALYVSGRFNDEYRLVAIGAGVALLSAAFRIHIAIPAVALYVVLVVATARLPHPWRRYHLVGAVLIAFLGIALVFESIALAPHFFSGRTDGLRYIEAVHFAAPTAYEGVFQALGESLNPGMRGVFVGYPLMLAAQYGLVLPALLVSSLFLNDLRLRAHLLGVAAGLLAVHAAITFFIPTPGNGDITEWSHRSFVLIYGVLVIYTVVGISATPLFDSSRLKFHKHRNLNIGMVSFLSVLGLLIPWFYGKNIQYGSLRDGPTACATPISPDMFSAAEFIKLKSGPSDKILASNGDPDAALVALTGLQAYVSRGLLYQKMGTTSALAQARIISLIKLRKAGDFQQLAEFGKASGVRWFVVSTDDMPQTAAMLIQNAAFVSGKTAVFDLYGPSNAMGELRAVQ